MRDKSRLFRVLGIAVLAAGMGIVFLGGKPQELDLAAFEKRGASERSVHKSIFSVYPEHKINFVMLGDSLTNFVNWNELLGRLDVANRGLTYQTSAGVLELADSVISLKPKLCFIMIGINDLRQGRSVEEVFENQRRLVTVLRQGGVEPVLQSVLFPGGDTAQAKKTASLVKSLNQKLQSYASEEHLDYLDLNAVIAPQGALPDPLSYDKLHLLGPGYALWAKSLNAYLESRGLGHEPAGSAA